MGPKKKLLKKMQWFTYRRSPEAWPASQVSERCPWKSRSLFPSSDLLGVGRTLRQALLTCRPPAAPRVSCRLSNAVEGKHFLRNSSFTIPREDSQRIAHATYSTTAESTGQGGSTAVPRSQGGLSPLKLVNSQHRNASSKGKSGWKKTGNEHR